MLQPCSVPQSVLRLRLLIRYFRCTLFQDGYLQVVARVALILSSRARNTLVEAVQEVAHEAIELRARGKALIV